MKKYITIVLTLLCASVVSAQRNGDLIESRDFIAHQSTTMTNQTAQLAVDGDRNTYSLTEVEANAYLKIDLKSRYRINQIGLTSNSLSNFYIFFSKAPIVSGHLNTLIADPWVDYIHVSGNLPADGFIPVNNILTNYVTIINAGSGDLLVNDAIFFGDGPMSTNDHEICNNGIDDDGDGRIDCEDPDCGVGLPMVTQVAPRCNGCSDGVITVNSIYSDYISIDGGQNWVPSSGDPWVPTEFGDLPFGDYPIKTSKGNGCLNEETTISFPPPPPPPFSPLGEDVFDAVSSSDTEGVTPLATGGNALVDVMVDGPEIYQVVSDLMRTAEFEILIGLLTWETGCTASDAVRDALLFNESQRDEGDQLPLRIMLQDFPLFGGDPAENIHDEINTWGLDATKWEIQIVTVLDWGDGNYHSKIFIVDGKKMVVTGANIEFKHDPGDPWRDTGYWIEGDAGISGMDDYDLTWQNEGKHWECENGDCDQRSEQWPIPNRDWLPQVQTASGNSTIIYAGTGSHNGPNSPQNNAWITLMDGAQSVINVATPNIGSRDFEEAIIRAIRRGVTVNLITSRLFNAPLMNFGGGGYNRETVSNIRQNIRSFDPTLLPLFNLKWYSYDGKQDIIGNVPRAMHAKFMSVDDQIAMVGSGNQEAFSWNHNIEINFVIDNADDVAMMHDAFFTNDLENSIDQVIEFYEAVNIGQDIVAIENTIFNHHQNFASDPMYYSVNDEARSAVINNTPADKRIRIFNSTNPDDQFRKSWMEIITKNDITAFNIDSLHTTLENNNIAITYNPNYDDDHLNGKVSYVTIDDYTPEPMILLYEGNDATQNLICALPLKDPLGHVDFTTTNVYACQNDEARSVKLLDMQEGATYRLFDNSDGDMDDPFVSITIKRNFFSKIINNLNDSFEDDDVRVTSWSDNDLDGKVSSFSDTLYNPVIMLYEGNNATQNLVCTIPLDGTVGHVNFTESNIYQCTNDEARSARLLNMVEGRVYNLFDNSDGDMDDDFVTIEIKQDFSEKIVGSFENDFEDADIKITHCCDEDLDGKVSAFSDLALLPTIMLYEGNNASQNLVCAIPVETTLGCVNFTSNNIYQCENDEAQSARLLNMQANSTYNLFDSYGCSTTDDFVIIEVKQDFVEKVIPNFETSFEDDDVKVTYCCGGNLNGKVSSINDTGGISASRIIFYEGEDASESVVCTIPLDNPVGHVNFTSDVYGCENDEAQSAVLWDMEAGNIYRIFDSSSGSTNDDYLIVEIKQDFAEKLIPEFEESFEDSQIKVTYCCGGNLNGKVSSFRDY
ncbi:MAG: phosphatidylserine/phosphatidylglycerophosphate/cardiolipin synthase family protein [Bacteroidota bacterium]